MALFLLWQRAAYGPTLELSAIVGLVWLPGASCWLDGWGLGGEFQLPSANQKGSDYRTEYALVTSTPYDLVFTNTHCAFAYGNWDSSDVHRQFIMNALYSRLRLQMCNVIDSMINQKLESRVYWPVATA